MTASVVSSDAELLSAARAGKQAAIAELWKRHHAAAVAHARSLVGADDAEDVTADAFGKVFGIIGRGRGATDVFRPYLYTVIRNLAHEEYRRRGRTTDHEIDFDDMDSGVTGADVSVSLGGCPVLEGVSLRVEPGELVAVIGPNGAGKSTLLGALAGDVTPSSGRVLLGEDEVRTARARDLARRRAVMPQDHTIAFPFLVADVVRMGRAPWVGADQEHEDDEVIAHALDVAGVTHLADRPMPALSGGERARVAFARAFAQRTGTLFLDEPTASLDVDHQEDLLTEARRLADTEWTVVVVLHDLTLAGAYADRIALLANGRLIMAGTPSEVLTAERVSTVYGHPIFVVPDPLTGTPLVIPDRSHRTAGRRAS